MEELGIGRPSTFYASTLAVIEDRGYVRTDSVILEDKGRLVIAFPESFFKRYVEYDFTADLEEKLDLISNGDSSNGARCCATSGATSRRRSARSRTCASATCSRR